MYKSDIGRLVPRPAALRRVIQSDSLLQWCDGSHRTALHSHKLTGTSSLRLGSSQGAFHLEVNLGVQAPEAPALTTCISSPWM